MNRFDQIQATARDVAQWVRAGVEDTNEVKEMADDLIKLITLIVQATGKGVAIEGESELNEVHARGFEPDTMSNDYSDEELASQEAEFEQEKERDAAKAHNRYLIGERMQDAASETHVNSTNPEVDLERYDPTVWHPREWLDTSDYVVHDEMSARLMADGASDPFEPGELTVKARAAADAMREGPAVPVLPPVGTPWKPEEVAHRRTSEPVDIREASIRLPDAAARLVPVDDDRRPLFAPGAEAYCRNALGLPEKKDPPLVIPQGPPANLLAPHTWVTATDGDTGRTLDWQHCGVCSMRRCDGSCGDASVGATPDIDCATHGDAIAQQCHGGATHFVHHNHDAATDDAECGWLPGDATTACDFDPRCRVHGDGSHHR